MNLINEIKLRLGIDGTKYDGLIESYLNQVKAKVLAYCNLTELPAALNYVLVSMAVDLLRIEGSGVISDVAGINEKEVAEIQRGDVRIRYGQGGTETTSRSKRVIDELVLEYRQELNRYRRLRVM